VAGKADLSAEGERKQITVLFSDLSRYTFLSESIDPEEVKDVMSCVFGEIVQVVTQHQGYTHKFVGDAIMVLFGLPISREDDPIRAIRAAKEFHRLVESLTPRFKGTLKQPLLIHSGINTGLVVTGSLVQGSEGAEIVGETVNVATRLMELAKAGEILVGPETYRQAQGYFDFEKLGSLQMKGKTEPVQAYRALSLKEEPITIHRFSGLRADFIGREAELGQLRDAISRLGEGKTTIVTLCGEAGSGKSRLVEHFKETLDPNAIQWREGHAYAYAQNIPYFPLVDLLNRAWHIQEADGPDVVKVKIETAVERLDLRKEDVVPYIGRLYALDYPELADVSPESWKFNLREVVKAILGAICARRPTLICLEDLHWADPSSIDLFRYILSDLSYPVLFLSVYRPPFSLIPNDQANALQDLYREIRLGELSSREAQDMLGSLLKTNALTLELKSLVQQKAEGNPFYLEEVVNSLIETGILKSENGSWRLVRSIRQADVPTTVQGVISARIDRLEGRTRRVLQEASVIGRAFVHELLQRITESREEIDDCLGDLQKLDLVRIKSLHPNVEYTFKHALTQEVAYNSLLKKDRQKIHEKIAVAIEDIFKERLAEFYETLAFHFVEALAVDKAIFYLIKSGEKGLNQYALDESQKHFKEAYAILSSRELRSKQEELLLIEVLLKWSIVFYYRGDFAELTDLLIAHKGLAESVGDRAKLGMYYASLGFALRCREEFEESYRYLRKALELGEEITNPLVIGYACSQLGWTCAELGLLDEAVQFGERARDISKLLVSDHFLTCISYLALGQACWYRGDSKKAFEVGEALVEFGDRYAHARSTVCGYYTMGHSYFIAGDLPSAIECYKKAVDASADPYYSHFPRTTLGYAYVSNGQFEKAEEVIKEVYTFSRNSGVEIIGTAAHGLLGMVMTGMGNFSEGIKRLEDVRKIFSDKKRRCLYAASEVTLGRVYLQVAHGKRRKDLSLILRNLKFLSSNLFVASKKAELHFNRAVETAKAIGAKSILAQAYFNLGQLYRARKKSEKARIYFSQAVSLFEQCQAETYLQQAREALASLDPL
jgi:predicted ATPase/class 3 adenylate cyclase